MIEGMINAKYDAVVNLRVQGPDGRTLEIEAVVDTGYSGFLTLSSAVVAELDLPHALVREITLADDSTVELDVHRVNVFWDGEPITIPADIIGSTPLIGMLLLNGYRLIIDVEVGGAVIIQPKP